MTNKVCWLSSCKSLLTKLLPCIMVHVAACFAPWRVHPHRVHPHINSTRDQVLKMYLSPTEKKTDNIVCTMKQNHPRHVYFSFFNLGKVTGELEIESLGLVHSGELAMGRNRYHCLI